MTNRLRSADKRLERLHPVLTTGRFRLHAWSADDLPLLVALHSDPEVQRYLAARDAPWSEHVLRARLDRFIADYAEHGWTKFKVLDACGEFVGRAGFSRYEPTGELELGYSLMKSRWGQGMATELAQALIEWIYPVAKVGHVIGFTEVDNSASRRVLEKADMVLTGVYKADGHMMAFYRHDRTD